MPYALAPLAKKGGFHHKYGRAFCLVCPSWHPRVFPSVNGCPPVGDAGYMSKGRGPVGLPASGHPLKRVEPVGYGDAGSSPGAEGRCGGGRWPSTRGQSCWKQ